LQQNRDTSLRYARSGNIRVAIAFDNFGPYHIARLNAAAKEVEVLAVERASTSALYAWDSPDVPDGLARVVLSTDKNVSRPADVFAAIEAKVAPFKPDAVAVPGWSSQMALALASWAVARDIPVIAMSETNPWDFDRKWGTEFLKRRIFEYFSAGLCTNDGQAAYLSTLGLPRDAIFRGYNVVDNDYFRQTAAAAKRAPMPGGEGGVALPEAARGRYFLASNRFIPKKNLAVMLDAYARFREGRDDDPTDWPLVLLGDGDLRPALERQRDALGLASHVHMPGFRQYDELPAYYGTAGCFVHASTVEQWGLVVNEAMAAGLPVIVSDRCGCAPVLVRSGVNGFAFPPHDKEALANAMESIAALEDDGAMREASLALVAECAPERFGAGMAGAARHATAAPRARPSLLARAVVGFATRRIATQ
jgi:glycosyltransferase involved in cell wall biosynthesis